MPTKVLSAGDGRRLNVLGDNMLVRLTGADTGGLFTLIEQTNPPGVGIPLHLHDHQDELFEILEGTMAFTVNGETTQVSAGGTVFLPRGLPHAFMTVGTEIVRTHVMVFPAGIEHMFEELSALPPGPPDLDTAFEICRRHGIRFLGPVEPGGETVGA